MLSQRRVSVPHDCSVCGLRCTRPFALEEHMRVHTGERPFTCNQCGKTFRRQRVLRQHVSSTHSTCPPSITSPACNSDMQSTKSNNDDLSTLLGSIDKRHVCPVCDKRYRRKSDMLDHRRSHTGERPFHCSICNASFGRKKVLRQHILCVHKQIVGAIDKTPGSESKSLHNFAYSNIGSGDHEKTRNTLKSFIKNHNVNVTLKRQAVCPICNKRLARVASIKGHLRVAHGINDGLHDSSKNSAEHVITAIKTNLIQYFLKRPKLINPADSTVSNHCKSCGMGFQSQNILHEHESTVHQQNTQNNLSETGERISCRFCVSVFISRLELFEHARNVHGILSIDHERQLIGAENTRVHS